LPWLTSTGLRAVTSAAAATLAAVPLGWNKVLRDAVWRSRYFTVCQANFGAMGASADVQVFHPFVAGPVLDALANLGGFAGLGGRTNVMRVLCGDLLPEAVVTRRSKGTFTAPLWTSTARDFARAWSGEGLDRSIIDVDALRSHWAVERLNLLSTTLLQAAWLHDNPAPGNTYAAPTASSSATDGDSADESGHGFIHP
jgi:asparagine synthase (glutamine-hydrolysing)